MIRVGTMIWLGLIGASSAFLFKTSYEVQSLEGDLRGLNRSILREQDSIRVMHAEWAFLNQPSRLQALTDQFTKLRPIAPTQMVASAADLPMPLPSLDGEPMAPPASLVAQVDALPSFGPVPLPGHRPGEGGLLLAAAAPMPVQIPAVSPQPAAAPAAAGRCAGPGRRRRGPAGAGGGPRFGRTRRKGRDRRRPDPAGGGAAPAHRAAGGRGPGPVPDPGRRIG